MKCKRCKKTAAVALPSHNAAFCPECYLLFFERQVAKAVKAQAMCSLKDKILVAVSGGKDSLALVWQMHTMGYDVTALHLDLGIGESSAAARKFTENLCSAFDIALRVVEFESLGMGIPLVKKTIKRPICSVCGKLKRYVFNRYAVEHGFNVLATGHNLDDETARLMANTLRWDDDQLAAQSPHLPAEPGFASKIKPLYLVSEFETAALCFLAGLEYGHHPCPYSRGATFTQYKILLNRLEEIQPGRKRSFYDSFLNRGRPFFLQANAQGSEGHPAPCTQCGFPTTAGVCSICRIRQAMDLDPIASL